MILTEECPPRDPEKRDRLEHNQHLVLWPSQLLKARLENGSDVVLDCPAFNTKAVPVLFVWGRHAGTAAWRSGEIELVAGLDFGDLVELVFDIILLQGEGGRNFDKAVR